MTLTYEQKRAFHDKTAEELRKTPYDNVIAALQFAYQSKKIDEETLKYVVAALFTISSQMRALTLGLRIEDIQFTPEETEQNRRYMNEQRNQDS